MVNHIKITIQDSYIITRKFNQYFVLVGSGHFCWIRWNSLMLSGQWDVVRFVYSWNSINDSISGILYIIGRSIYMIWMIVINTSIGFCFALKVVSIVFGALNASQITVGITYISSIHSISSPFQSHSHTDNHPKWWQWKRCFRLLRIPKKPLLRFSGPRTFLFRCFLSSLHQRCCAHSENIEWTPNSFSYLPTTHTFHISECASLKILVSVFSVSLTRFFMNSGCLISLWNVLQAVVAASMPVVG